MHVHGKGKVLGGISKMGGLMHMLRQKHDDLEGKDNCAGREETMTCSLNNFRTIVKAQRPNLGRAVPTTECRLDLGREEGETPSPHPVVVVSRWAAVMKVTHLA